MTTVAKSRDIPMAMTAARILSPETLRGLEEFYASDALKVSTDKGAYDPAKQRTKWIKHVLKESPATAEYLMSRFLWHHNHQTLVIQNWRDFEFVTGLLQFDSPEASTLTREQETIFLKVTKSIYSAKGAARFTRTYGNDLIGTWMMDEELIRYAMDHPEHLERFRTILRERGVVDASEMVELVELVSHDSLTSGVL